MRAKNNHFSYEGLSEDKKSSSSASSSEESEKHSKKKLKIDNIKRVRQGGEAPTTTFDNFEKAAVFIHASTSEKFLQIVDCTGDLEPVLPTAGYGALVCSKFKLNVILIHSFRSC